MVDFIDRCLGKKTGNLTPKEEEELRQYYELLLRMNLELITRPPNAR